MVKWKPKRDEIKMPTDSGATGAQSCQVIKTCWNCSLAMERLGLRLGLCSVVLFEFVSSQTFGERFGATRILVGSHCRLHGSLQSLPTRILVAPNLSVVNAPYMAKGMQKYEALYMVTAFQGSNIVSNSLSALIILQEVHRGHDWGPLVLSLRGRSRLSQQRTGWRSATHPFHGRRIPERRGGTTRGVRVRLLVLFPLRFAIFLPWKGCVAARLTILMTETEKTSTGRSRGTASPYASFFWCIWHVWPMQNADLCLSIRSAFYIQVQFLVFHTLVICDCVYYHIIRVN